MTCLTLLSVMASRSVDTAAIVWGDMAWTRALLARRWCSRAGSSTVRRAVLYRRDAIGTWTPVQIGSRAQAILTLLLEQPGTLVSKDAIMEAVWPNTAVEPNNLNVQIAALRRVLDRDRSDGSYIQTVSGRGYRFVLCVTRPEAGHADLATVPPRLSIVVLPFENQSDEAEERLFGRSDYRRSDQRSFAHPRSFGHRARICRRIPRAAQRCAAHR